MADHIFKPTPNIETPGVATNPFGNALANASGSNYASNYSLATTKMLQDAILYAIFDSAPAQYNALKLLYSTPFETVKSDEFIYFEEPWGRPTIEAFTWDETTPTTGTIGTLTIAGTYTSEDDMPAIKGDIVTTASGEPLMVVGRTFSAVANSCVLLLKVQTGGTLTAGDITAGDFLAIQSATIGDGMNDFYHYDRATADEKYNYVQRFQRCSRWNTWELINWQNKGVTDFVERDKMKKLNQLRVDMFSTFMNGTRGEFQIPGVTSGQYRAKTMGGIYPIMVNAGAQHASPTITGLKTAFESLAFSTNFKAEGGLRYIYATDEMIYNLSKEYKETYTRYTPNDKIANFNLNEFIIGTMRFVPIPCELFKEKTVFPETWNNKILVVDKETIKPTIMEGYPHLNMGETKDKREGTREDYKDWWVEAQLGLKFNNPIGGFYIDVV